MAKTYSRSEITPDLLNLNIQYFFNKPVRDYKRGMDEIVLSYSPDMERWYKIMDYWENFCANPSVVTSRLRNVAEKLASTATPSNMNVVLDIFKELTEFMTTALNGIDDEDSIKLSKEIAELNVALYDTTAQREQEAELERQKAKVKADANALEELMEVKSTEQQVLQDLQEQITELGKMIDDLGDKSTDTKSPVDSEYTKEAKRRVAEANKNAHKIADFMENEIKQRREAEEIHKQEELIRRSAEKEEFDASWKRYVDKYTISDEKPTAELFKKFLIDIKGLTPKQIDKMQISAAIFDDGIVNFIEFDEEIQRVKTAYPSE